MNVLIFDSSSNVKNIKIYGLNLTIPQNKIYSYPDFRGEKTKVWSGLITYLRSHSVDGLNPDSLTRKPKLLPMITEHSRLILRVHSISFTLVTDVWIGTQLKSESSCYSWRKTFPSGHSDDM